jgi:hypothetical protein
MKGKKPLQTASPPFTTVLTTDILRYKHVLLGLHSIDKSVVGEELLSHSNDSGKTPNRTVRLFERITAICEPT